MSETTIYPFSTDDLVKGSTVTVTEIERAYTVKFDSPEYQFAWLQAREFVIRKLSERGEIVTVVQRDGNLMILTDEQQVAYNSDQFKAGIRKARRSHMRMLGADRSQITDPEILAMHDRWLEVQGRVLSAVSRETQALAPTPHQRSTPLLPGAKRGKGQP